MTGPCMEQGPAFPPAGFRPLCALEEGHEGPHDFAPQLAERNRQRAQVSAVCPDTGTCHHNCSECYGGACWRVFNAGPLSGVFDHDQWPLLIRQAEQISLAAGPNIEPGVPVRDRMEFLMEQVVDAWHKDAYGEITLHEALGMTWEEYSAWVEGREKAEPDTQSMYVEIHVAVGPELSSAHSHRSVKLRVRAVTEERDPAQAATYSIVAAFREAADRLEEMTSGPPVADTTTARVMADEGTFKP